MRMNSKNFGLVTTIVFGTATLLHLLRLVNGWELQIGSFMVPIAVSWIVLFVGSYLTWQAISLWKK